MKRTILILTVLCVGCDSASSQTADTTAPGYTVRERELIDMCNEIAVEREILASKYNALIEVHNLDYRQEPITVRRCT